VGIFQVMKISEAITRLILQGGDAMQLADQAQREGVSDLRQSGLRKVKAGLIGLEELNRVTKE
jgi:type IV pilus assembly protein PilB